MKHCVNCGEPVSDTHVFCFKCGYKFEQNVGGAGETAVVQSEMLETAAELVNVVEQTPESAQNPYIKLLKKSGSSPLFVFAIILFVIHILSAMVNIFFSYPVYDILEGIRSADANVYFEIRELVNGVIEPGYGVYIMYMLLRMVPFVLTMSGMILFYSACKEESVGKSTIATTGLSLIKSVTVFAIILDVISVLALEATCVFLFSYFGRYSISEEVLFVLYAIIIAFMVVFPVVYCFNTIYNTLILKTASSLKKTAFFGIRPTKMLKNFAVINLLIGCLNGILGLLAVLSSINNLAAVPNAISSISNAVFLFIISIMLLRFINKADDFIVV